ESGAHGTTRANPLWISAVSDRRPAPMMTNARVAQYMSSNPRTILPTATLRDARRLMNDLGVRHLPVVVEGRILGIIAQHDLHQLAAIHDLDFDATTAELAMARPPYCVREDASVAASAAEMAKRRIGSALV